MQNKNTRGVFSPVSVVKPSWMTPDFNPQIADRKFRENKQFTAYTVIPLLLDILSK